MQNPHDRSVVILGTGGTIAGVAPSGQSDLSYQAAQLGVDALVRAVPELAGVPLQAEQVAQVDSKDMTHAVWQVLAQRVHHHLVRDEVAGVVVTHGTDTMEESAYLLHRVLAPNKPVVLTGAMRPASSRQADGPDNLRQAVALAREPGAHGVLVAMAGTVHGAADVRKTHPHRLDAFGSGDVGPLARFEDDGRLRRLRAWPSGDALGIALLDADPATWPVVEVVTSHAGASGALIDALARSGAKGVVIAATGNGTVHQAIEQALRDAAWSGMRVLRATRCGDGAILEADEAVAERPAAGALTPAKARVELLLRLLGGN
ncbi:MAG TPA: asparaginase [Burkholderiaceae bacterium]|nr:asparaginase [Burkholderiaceae bacterium]